MPAPKEQPKTSNAEELDEYVQSLRSYLDKVGPVAHSLPDYNWKDLAANSQQYSHVKLPPNKWPSSVLPSAKKNYAK